MRKELISLSIISMMIFSPCFCMAAGKHKAIKPVVQEATSQEYSDYQTDYPLPSAEDYEKPYVQPAVSQPQQNEYQSHYPVPVNHYQSQGYNNSDQLRGNVVLVPANTSFPAIVATPISSETANVGDGVTFFLDSDFYYGGKLIAAAGSKVNGTIISVKRGGMASKNGKIQIRFSHIVTPTGQIIPITASVQTDDGSGVLKAGTVKDSALSYAKDTVIGAGVGAALGTALGALSRGGVGRGAIYGTAIGGGMGIIAALMERGGDIDIPQNVQMNIVLDQPVTVSSNTPY